MKKLLFVFFALLFLLTACGKNTGTWQEQYDLGTRSLSEGDYEEAINAFTAAIEIDPQREEAYIALAGLYYATGETEKADDILALMTDPKHEVTEEKPSAAHTERIDNDDGSYLITEYNDDGNVVREITYDSFDTVVWDYIHEYDSEGRLLKGTLYESRGYVYSYYHVDEYDDEGNPLRAIFYNSDGTKSAIQEFDSKKNLVRTIKYGLNNKVSSVFDYGSEGKVVLETRYSSEGFVSSIHEYDSEENPVHENFYRADGTVWATNEYTAEGERVATVYNDDGSVDWIEEYDATGKRVRMTWYNPDGTVKTAEY